MTLTQASTHIGSGVVYTPDHGPREDGVIVRVGARFVFVLYRGDSTPKATDPADLELLTPDRSQP